MPLVRYQVAISIDGFIAPADGSTQWLDPYGKAAWGFMRGWMKNIGGIVVGRTTYDQAAGMGGWMWGDTPALVMTSRPLEHTSTSVEAFDGDPNEAVQRLARRIPLTGGQDIWLFGGGVAAGRFLEAGAVDLLELAVVPVLLGEGRPLFAGVSLQRTFEPAGAAPIGEGCVVTTYRKISAQTPSPRARRRPSPGSR
jgi:dihydrofolate reductase